MRQEAREPCPARWDMVDVAETRPGPDDKVFTGQEGPVVLLERLVACEAFPGLRGDVVPEGRV